MQDVIQPPKSRGVLIVGHRLTGKQEIAIQAAVQYLTAYPKGVVIIYDSFGSNVFQKIGELKKPSEILSPTIKKMSGKIWRISNPESEDVHQICKDLNYNNTNYRKSVERVILEIAGSVKNVCIILDGAEDYLSGALSANQTHGLKKNADSNVFVIALFDRILVLPNKLVNFWDEMVLLNTGEEGLKVRELQKRIRKPNNIIRELYRPLMSQKTENSIQNYAQISLDDNDIWLKIQ
jgi:hypothetical protein